MAEVAEFFGLTDRTLRTWKSEPGFPVEDDGTYSPISIYEWKLSIEADEKEIRRRKITADMKVSEEEAKAKALKNRQTEGELVSREAVKRAVKRIFTYVRQVLEAYPARAATEFPEATRSDNVENFQRFIRLELRKLAGQAENFEESLD